VIKIEAPTEIQIGEMYRIPKSMFAPDEIRMRKVELTIESTIDGASMGFGSGGGPVKLYEEALNTFGVPRRWGFANYKDLPITDRTVTSRPVAQGSSGDSVERSHLGKPVRLYHGGCGADYEPGG
jgi:hypothetical protein